MTFKMYYDERNRKNLDKLAPNTRGAAYRFYQYCLDNKVDILIYETRRTIEQQKRYVADGKSKTLESYHLVGQALDFVPVEQKNTLWNAYERPDVKKAVAYAKSIGFEWGGDWKNFIDKPHLQFNYKGYGTDKLLDSPVQPAPVEKKVEKAYFYTGGYKGESLEKLHTFLYDNQFWFEPTRNSTGTLMFNIGAFTPGTEKYKRMKTFLDDMGAWYQISNK